MKICNQCEADKPISDFYTNGKCGTHPKCKDCTKKNIRESRAANPDKYREYEKLKHSNNPSVKKASIRRYYIKNRESRIAAEKARYIKNSEYIKQRCRDYRKANMDKVYAHNGSRRQAEKTARPIWADLNEIAKLYEWSDFITKETGIRHHVDHIIPLKGKTVCGLHIHPNMQVIPATENLRKSASFNG